MTAKPLHRAHVPPKRLRPSGPPVSTTRAGQVRSGQVLSPWRIACFTSAIARVTWISRGQAIVQL